MSIIKIYNNKIYVRTAIMETKRKGRTRRENYAENLIFINYHFYHIIIENIIVSYVWDQCFGIATILK